MKRPQTKSRLGTHTTLISSGSTPRGGESTYLKSGPVMLIRSQNVRMNQLDLSDVAFISEEIHGKMRRSVVQHRDVLLNITGASIGRVAMFDHSEARANVNQHVCIIRSKPAELDAGFLTHYLASPDVQREINDRHQHGGTRQALTFGQIGDLEIPLPPLSEQKRIAAILDQAYSLRRKRQRSLDLADQFLRSAFLDHFGDPVTNPKGFQKVLLSEIADGNEGVKCGPFGTQLSKSEFQKDGVPLWGIKHVNRYFRIPTEEFISHAKAKELDGYLLKSGDLVMTRKGTVGNCAIYPESFPNGIMHSDLLRIRLNPVKCIPSFLSWQFTFSPDIAQQISMLSQGAIMAGINVTKLKQISVLLPPIDLQNRFADVVRTQSAMVDRQRKMNVTESILVDALVQMAFRGDL